MLLLAGPLLCRAGDDFGEGGEDFRAYEVTDGVLLVGRGLSKNDRASAWGGAAGGVFAEAPSVVVLRGFV